MSENQSTMARFIRGVAAALAAATLTGCGLGSDGLPHQNASGVVTLDGQPLENGSIVFVPTAGEAEPTGGQIKDGAFTIPLEVGPVPGPYVVSIYSRKTTGKMIQDPDDPSQTIEEGFEQIPARYNVSTELKADVAEGGENHFEFKLEGGVKSPPKRR